MGAIPVIDIGGPGSPSFPKASRDTNSSTFGRRHGTLTDRDIAPGGLDVIRKCFWLNTDYVERIIREQHERR